MSSEMPFKEQAKAAYQYVLHHGVEQKLLFNKQPYYFSSPAKSHNDDWRTWKANLIEGTLPNAIIGQVDGLANYDQRVAPLVEEILEAARDAYSPKALEAVSEILGKKAIAAACEREEQRTVAMWYAGVTAVQYVLEFVHTYEFGFIEPSLIPLVDYDGPVIGYASYFAYPQVLSAYDTNMLSRMGYIPSVYTSSVEAVGQHVQMWNREAEKSPSVHPPMTQFLAPLGYEGKTRPQP